MERDRDGEKGGGEVNEKGLTSSSSKGLGSSRRGMVSLNESREMFSEGSANGNWTSPSLSLSLTLSISPR